MSSEAIFIQVGALADGFAPQSNTLEKQNGLAGKRLTLHFSNGGTAECQFNDESTLNWGSIRTLPTVPPVSARKSCSSIFSTRRGKTPPSRWSLIAGREASLWCTANYPMKRRRVWMPLAG